MQEPDYSRQVCLPEVGEDGQRRLKESRVLVVGAGGTGSPVIMYLASAGLRRVDVCDSDVVEASNLHRQILHRDLGEDKAISASRWIRGRQQGSWCEWSTERLEDVAKFSPASETRPVDYDVVIDCTDRWSAHRDIVMSSLRAGKTVVHGSIGGLLGRVMTFGPGSPCWLCLHPSSPDGVKSVPRGTLGPVCGIIGSVMAMEALRIVLGMGPSLLGRMLTFDAKSMAFSKFEMTKLPECTGCGTGGIARPSTPSIISNEPTPSDP